MSEQRGHVNSLFLNEESAKRLSSNNRVQRFQQAVQEQAARAKKRMHSITKDSAKSFLRRNAFVLFTITAVLLGREPGACRVVLCCLGRFIKLAQRVIKEVCRGQGSATSTLCALGQVPSSLSASIIRHCIARASTDACEGSGSYCTGHCSHLECKAGLHLTELAGSALGMFAGVRMVGRGDSLQQFVEGKSAHLDTVIPAKGLI